MTENQTEKDTNYYKNILINPEKKPNIESFDKVKKFRKLRTPAFVKNPDFYNDEKIFHLNYVNPSIIPKTKKQHFGWQQNIIEGYNRNENIYDHGSTNPHYYIRGYRRMKGYGIAFAPQI